MVTGGIEDFYKLQQRRINTPVIVVFSEATELADDGIAYERYQQVNQSNYRCLEIV